MRFTSRSPGIRNSPPKGYTAANILRLGAANVHLGVEWPRGTDATLAALQVIECTNPDACISSNRSAVMSQMQLQIWKVGMRSTFLQSNV